MANTLSTGGTRMVKHIRKFTMEEQKILENLFGMESGYVLNFSNKAFREFFLLHFGIDIYDEKYKDLGSSKANRLRTFWEKESNDLVADSIDGLISRYDMDCVIDGIVPNKTTLKKLRRSQAIANHLRDCDKRSQQKKTLDFLDKNYDIDVTSLNLDPAMEEIIIQRLDEIKKCIENGIVLGATLLIGSVLEGLLLDFARKHPEEYNKADSAPKNKDGRVKPFKEWSLNSLIIVAREKNYIGLDVKEFNQILRNFRNYIHPAEQIKQNFKPNKDTVQLLYQALLVTMNNLRNL